MTNGCICCTLRDDLLEEVDRLAREGRFDHLLIESSGISEPMPVAATSSFPRDDGATLGDLARLDTMVTVVDAANFLAELDGGDELVTRGLDQYEDDERTVSDLLMDQVEFADVIVLNKLDLVGPDEAAGCARPCPDSTPRPGPSPPYAAGWPSNRSWVRACSTSNGPSRPRVTGLWSQAGAELVRVLDPAADEGVDTRLLVEVRRAVPVGVVALEDGELSGAKETKRNGPLPIGFLSKSCAPLGDYVRAEGGVHVGELGGEGRAESTASPRLSVPLGRVICVGGTGAGAAGERARAPRPAAIPPTAARKPWRRRPG